MSLLLRMAATPWAIEHTVGDNLADIVIRHDSGVRLSTDQISAAIGRAVGAGPIKTDYQVRRGVAIVPISGVIARFASQVNNGSQPQGTSTEAILQDLRAALADESVNAIMLLVDSPGGAVSGVKEAADIIRAAAGAKPMVALIDDLGASAAYWLAAGASKIYATETAAVGSIGVYSVLVDRSAQAEKEGVKVRRVSSGPYKGAGVPGTPITDAQVAAAQVIVDQLASMFFSAVSSARGLTGDALTAVTDGRVHLAAAAQTLGLIDGVKSFDQLLGELAQSPKSPARAQRASAHPTKPESSMRITALFAMALVAACPSQASFIQDQVAKAEKDESITEASLKLAALEGECKALREKATADATAHAAAIKAKDEEITRLKASVADTEAKRDALAGIKDGAGKDPGADPAATGAKAGVDLDARCRAEFAASAELQEQFALGGVDSYVAFKKQEARKAAAK